MSVGTFATGADVYIGKATPDGMPQNIDEAIAMTNGEVIHAVMPQVDPEDAMILFTSASTLSADFDQDGDVDGDDFLTWQTSFGANAGGDTDNDGDTDGDDFLAWQTQFGAGTGGGSTETAGIPEPPTGSLLFLGAAGALGLAARRRLQTILDRSFRIDYA